MMTERKSLVSPANLVYWPLIMALALVFYAPHQAGAELDAGTALWSGHYSPHGLGVMAIFLALEVGVYGLCIAACWRLLAPPWRTMGVVVATFSVVWVLVPGEVGHGGFTMRASIPTLLLLFLMIMHVLTLKTPKTIRLVVAVCLALGAASAVQEIARSILRYPATLPAPRPAIDVWGMSKRHRNEFLMPGDSRLYRLVFRTPQPPP